MNQATARLLPPSSSSSAAAAASLPSSKHPPKPQPPPNFLAQAHRRTARVRLVLSSLAILAVFVFAASSNRAGRPQLLRTPEGEAWVLGQLEREYAVCAPKAGGVFTAEGDGGAQGERCLVVSGSEIVELASLETVQCKYGDRNTLGPPTRRLAEREQQVGWAVPKGGLKVYHLPKGATITPGLVDSHGHLMMYGQWKTSVDLTGAKSMADVVDRLKTFVAANPDVEKDKDRWIAGVGWDQNLWPGRAFPSWEDLEREPLLQGRKIVLTRIDSHALLASSAVLALLSPLPSSVPGGAILLSPTTGQPTGMLLDNAMLLVDAVRGEPDEAEMARALRKVTLDAVSKGLVGVHDAGTSLREIAFYTAQAKKGALPMRVFSMIACPDRGVYCGADVDRIQWDEYDGRFRVEGVKLVADGALGSWGAAMHAPYADREADGWRGILLANESPFGALVDDWVAGGWQVNVHAIGDRANTVVLDAFAPHLPSSSPANPLRLRLEHAQILTPADIARVIYRSVIASFQPTHATSDMGYAEAKLGPERIRGAYAWRSVVDGGGRIALGSDFPIESIDPLKGFYAAVTRLDERGGSPHGPGGWYPEERLTRAQALKGMTLDAAYASFSENITGSLVPGKRADYVVWDRDLLTCPPAEILQAKALMTVIDGQPVWGSL